MRFRLFVLIWLIFLMSIGYPTVAQETTVETVITPSTDLPTQVADDRNEQILLESESVLAEAKSYAAEAREATNFANSLLNLFQVVNFIVAIIGILLGLGGGALIVALWRRLSTARNKMLQDFQKISLAFSLLPLGEQQYLVQDFDGAIDTYQRGINLNENNPVLHYRIAHIYILKGELAAAENHLKKALQIDPTSSPSQAALGYVYRRKSEHLPDGKKKEAQLAEAQALLESALESLPYLVDADRQSWWGALASLYLKSGNRTKAIEAYRKAAEVTPDSSYPYGNIALLQLEENDYSSMADTYREAEKRARTKILIEPNNHWWYNDLLMARLALGESQAAQDTLSMIEQFGKTRRIANYPRENLIQGLTRLAQAIKSRDQNRADEILRVIAKLQTS